jgi:hypothetical protein
MKVTGFWHVTPCNLLETDRRSRGVTDSVIRTIIAFIAQHAKRQSSSGGLIHQI